MIIVYGDIMKTNYRNHRKIEWSKWQLLVHSLLAASLAFAQGGAFADYLVYENTSARSASSINSSISSKSAQDGLEKLLSKAEAATGQN